MRRVDIRELHSIMPIENVPSVMKHGILCFNGVKRLAHASVALAGVQNRRDDRTMPNGKSLHDFANLYFDARNPMMSRIRSRHNQVCVLRINQRVLDLSEVVITDGNAASDYTYFGDGIGAWRKLDKELIFAEDWTDTDPIKYYSKKRSKCAEVLIPSKISPEYIVGAYVSGERGLKNLAAKGFELPITIDAHMFFAD